MLEQVKIACNADEKRRGGGDGHVAGGGVTLIVEARRNEAVVRMRSAFANKATRRSSFVNSPSAGPRSKRRRTEGRKRSTFCNRTGVDSFPASSFHFFSIGDWILAGMEDLRRRALRRGAGGLRGLPQPPRRSVDEAKAEGLWEASYEYTARSLLPA